MHSASSSERRPSPRALAAELADRRERDEAARSDAALVAYEAKWQRKLRRLQQSYPERWGVPGLSNEEVRDLLTLRLLELVRTPEAPELTLSSPGKEWGLLVARKEVRAMRRAFGPAATPTGLSIASNYRSLPTQEDLCLENESARQHALAQARAEQGLTRPQRRWLAALRLSARAGGIFDASDEPNLSAASRVIGKHRSSAQRAYQELKARFARELERLG